MLLDITNELEEIKIGVPKRQTLFLPKYLSISNAQYMNLTSSKCLEMFLNPP